MTFTVLAKKIPHQAVGLGEIFFPTNLFGYMVYSLAYAVSYLVHGGDGHICMYLGN